MMQKKRTNRWLFAIYIGFFAGLIWGVMHYVFYYLDFTQLWPAFWIEPIARKAYLTSWMGHLAGITMWIIFSIIAAFVYTILFSKTRGPWMGLGFGIVVWLFIFILMNPLLGITKWIMRQDFTTISSHFCLMLIWGLFIGYSISFEFTQESAREG